MSVQAPRLATLILLTEIAMESSTSYTGLGAVAAPTMRFLFITIVAHLERMGPEIAPLKVEVDLPTLPQAPNSA
jgi:hypothetical protein